MSFYSVIELHIFMMIHHEAELSEHTFTYYSILNGIGKDKYQKTGSLVCFRQEKE